MSLSVEFREVTYTNKFAHMRSEYIEEIGLESELLLLHFPTLRIQQLTLLGCKSWGFVIYNQFSALVSSVLACAFCSLYPAPKALAAFLCCVGPVTLPFFFLPPSLSLFLSASSPSLSPCTAEARQVCPSCASSRSCLPWYIIREPREHRPTRSHNHISHMMLNIIDPLNKSSAKTTFPGELPQHENKSQFIFFLTTM